MIIRYFLQKPEPDFVKRWRCSGCNEVFEARELNSHAYSEHQAEGYSVDANEFYQHNPEAPIRGE